MAFSQAAGYNNLPNGAWSPQIYSKKVLKFFRKASTVEAITNNDYFGEIANFGDTVRIITEPTITVSSYVRGQEVTPQDLTDTELTLAVDQANKFAFAVDDIEEKQSHINWQELAASSGAYALRDAYDTNVLSYISGQVPTAQTYGTTGAALDMGFEATDSVRPLQIVNRLKLFLDLNNVPLENRWLTANPRFWEQMQDEDAKILDASWTGAGSSDVFNGKVQDRTIRGFTCYVTNNAPDFSASVYNVLAGHMSAVATASQIAKMETIRHPNTFADVVRGLHVFGRKALRTTAIAQAWYSVD